MVSGRALHNLTLRTSQRLRVPSVDVISSRQRSSSFCSSPIDATFRGHRFCGILSRKTVSRPSSTLVGFPSRNFYGSDPSAFERSVSVARPEELRPKTAIPQRSERPSCRACERGSTASALDVNVTALVAANSPLPLHTGGRWKTAGRRQRQLAASREARPAKRAAHSRH